MQHAARHASCATVAPSTLAQVPGEKRLLNIADFDTAIGEKCASCVQQHSMGAPKMSSNTLWGHPPPSHMTVQCTFGTESRRSRARAETVKLATAAASAEDRSCMHKTRVERTST